jgi:hypothetical protein
MDIQGYINQLQAVLDAANTDAAAQATTIAGLKASLATAQGAQSVDAIVIEGMADIIAKLQVLLPPAPVVPLVA